MVLRMNGKTTPYQYKKRGVLQSTVSKMREVNPQRKVKIKLWEFDYWMECSYLRGADHELNEAGRGLLDNHARFNMWKHKKLKLLKERKV